MSQSLILWASNLTYGTEQTELLEMPIRLDRLLGYTILTIPAVTLVLLLGR